jgi:hypothetical protein
VAFSSRSFAVCDKPFSFSRDQIVKEKAGTGSFLLYNFPLLLEYMFSYYYSCDLKSVHTE